MEKKSNIKGPSKILVAFFAFAGSGFFIWALCDLTTLAGSAESFRLHHEVTTPLCFLLAKVIGGILAGALVVQTLGIEVKMKIKPLIDAASLFFVALLLMVSGLVLENEAFFTLYDNKSLPVHPTQIVMHPKAGWMTPGDHLLICLAGITGIILFLIVSKNKRENR